MSDSDDECYYYDDDEGESGEESDSDSSPPSIEELEKLNEYWKGILTFIEGAERHWDSQVEISSTVSPEFDTPVSRDEIISAAHGVLETLEENLYAKEGGYEMLGVLVRELRAAVDEFSSHYLKCAAYHGDFWEDQPAYKQARTTALLKLRETEETVRFWRQDIDKVQEIDLQTRLQRLVRNQDEDLKQWFFAEKFPFAKHLTLGKCERLRVVLETKAPRPSNPNHRLPLEIKSMIYSLADLETCVALRQVSSDWYDSFAQIEPILAAKVTKRNPWFKPGDGDVTTWADCALFVGRIKTWTAVDTLDKMSPSDSAAQMKTVVAVEMKEGICLPRDFQGMVAHEPEDCHHKLTCELFHSQDDNVSDFMNPWTLQQVKSIPYDASEDVEVVRSNDSKTLVRYKGEKVVLPISVVDDEFFKVRVGPRTVMFLPQLETEDEMPLVAFSSRYKHDKRISASTTRSRESPLEVQLEDTVIVRSSDEQDYGYYDTDEHDIEYRYELLSWETNEMVLYAFADSTKHVPVASYKGLVWWNLDNSTLIPTFVDLDNEGEVYYRPEKAINGHEQDHGSFVQGGSAHRTRRYVFGSLGNEVDIFDLETGIITSVAFPQGCEGGRVYPGFVNGKFQPRCLSQEVVQKYSSFVSARGSNELVDS